MCQIAQGISYLLNKYKEAKKQKKDVALTSYLLFNGLQEALYKPILVYFGFLVAFNTNWHEL